MSLKEQVESMKSKLEEAKKSDAEETKKEDAALDKALEEPALEEKKDAEKAEDDKKVDADAVGEDAGKEEKPTADAAKEKTAADHAKERREKKKREDILASELATANARIAELQKPREEAKAASDPEPDKAEDPQAWNEWKIRHQDKELADLKGWAQEERTAAQSKNLREAAINQLNGFEAEVARANPDYGQAKSYYATMLATSMKMLSPNMTNQQLSVAVENAMIQRAGHYMREGHENPVDAMYQEAKAWGFQPKASEEAADKEIKPDLSKIAANKARNSGMAGANGRGGSAEITPKAAATMTNAEFARLKPDEKKKIFDRLRAAG